MARFALLRCTGQRFAAGMSDSILALDLATVAGAAWRDADGRVQRQAFDLRALACVLAAIVGPAAAGMLLVQVPKLEGTILRGYKDRVGIVTACAEHTKTAVLGRPYTPAECEQLLDQDLAEHATGVMRCITVPTTAGERAAFVSFGFNVGIGAFCRSTMARKLNAGDHCAPATSS